MKKIMAVFIIATSIMIICPCISTFAYSSAVESANTVVAYDSGGYYRLVAFNSPPSIRYLPNYLSYNIEGDVIGYSQPISSFNSLSDAVSYAFDVQYFYYSGSWSGSIKNNSITILKGSVNNIPSNWEVIDLQTPEGEETWYNLMWQDMNEYLGDPSLWIGDWFLNLINSVFGDDENDPTGPPKPPISTHVTIGNPTIAPTPTPIPYSTIVIPKTDIVTGQTVYETNYYYNISGTPIITSSPPSNIPSSGNGGDGTDYTPVGGDPYYIPKLSWLSNVEIGGENYDGIDSVTDGLSSIDAIGSEYTDGMSVVEDATGTLPTSWILLIGVAAAIPLVAGLISRFLS